MKYIFVAGAPGSKWSSVVKSIYFSESLDQSDYSEERTYYHSFSDPSKPTLRHLASYFDPGMEFGDEFENMSRLSIDELEEEFDRPFRRERKNTAKIIKSHVFSNQLEFLKKNWKEPIVLVLRSDDACIGWWVKCGEFNITYPNYQYYRDLTNMSKHVWKQNNGIRKFIQNNEVIETKNSFELSRLLGIHDDKIKFHDFDRHDIKVYVYWNKYCT
jgi:hypothetical protein